MALNDKTIHITGSKGANVYPGVANPLPNSTNDDPSTANFVDEPTSEVRGAGAGDNFDGARQAGRNSRSNIEAYPGIIESSHIHPLNEDSNKDDGWANANPTESLTGVAGNAISSAASMAAGAAKYAYGTAMGDGASKKAGREAIWK